MTSDRDTLWRRCAYLGRVLLPLLDQEPWRHIAAESGCTPGALTFRWGNDSVSSSRPQTVSYVVITRWSVHGAGYVELDCSGRLVGARQAVDSGGPGAAARWRDPEHA
jgi:hypothetical protein